eukprot:scaffold141020_cov17-Tisochrysis_lutea.AAC.1
MSRQSPMSHNKTLCSLLTCKQHRALCPQVHRLRVQLRTLVEEQSGTANAAALSLQSQLRSYMAAAEATQLDRGHMPITHLKQQLYCAEPCTRGPESTEISIDWAQISRMCWSKKQAPTKADLQAQIKQRDVMVDSLRADLQHSVRIKGAEEEKVHAELLAKLHEQ